MNELLKYNSDSTINDTVGAISNPGFCKGENQPDEEIFVMAKETYAHTELKN